MSERRLALVRALQRQGEISLRVRARRVGRDVKRVHEDVQALLELGLVERGEGGGVVWPFCGVTPKATGAQLCQQLLCAAPW